MNVLGIVFTVLLVALAALSVRSIAALRRRSLWTIGGWALSLAYALMTLGEMYFGLQFGHNLPDWYLGAMVVCFVIAGVRDEAQAEPWYWPQRRGLTRAQRRR